MRWLVISIMLLTPVCGGGAELPPQAPGSHLGGPDCEVVAAALGAYLERAREAGDHWGFFDLHFFVLDETQVLDESDIPVSRFPFSNEDNTAFDAIHSMPIYESLAKRAATRVPILQCDLPQDFGFAHSADDVQLDTIHEAFMYATFPDYDGIVSVTLPGHSPDECEALVDLYADFPIWSEHLIYHLVLEQGGWSVVRVFQSYMQGE